MGGIRHIKFPSPFYRKYRKACNPSVIGGKKVQGYPVLRSRLRVQSEGKVPGGIG
jgi:hypothetical protein